MTTGIIKSNKINKFLKQNHVDYNSIIDGFDGCLLDNMLYDTGRGILAIYEKYETPNSSVYGFIFAPWTEKESASKIWDDFTRLSQKSEV